MFSIPTGLSRKISEAGTSDAAGGLLPETCSSSPPRTWRKRVRPFLGTQVAVVISSARGGFDSHFNECITEAFHLGEGLGRRLSKFDPRSDVSRYNAGLKGFSPDFKSILRFSVDLAKRSGNAFTPFSGGKNKIDLSGVAKGHIADAMAENLMRRLPPDCSGEINAGGDLRFFGPVSERRVHLRVWRSGRPALRSLTTKAQAVATSSPGEAAENPDSSTVYANPPRSGLSRHSTVTVLADRALVADALTKVGLFGDPKIIDQCARVHHARILIFDDNGNLQETYPKCASLPD